MSNGPEFTLWDKHPVLRDFVFADLESSGLHEGSFPVQFGWCAFDLKPAQLLIRPMAGWREEDVDPKSVEIHGLEWDFLVEHGTPAHEVARRLNLALSGKTLITDAVDYDRMWSDRLFSDTGIDPEFRFASLDHLVKQTGKFYDPFSVRRAWAMIDHVAARYPHTHKADEDCLRLAALARVMIDGEWAGWIVENASAD